MIYEDSISRALYRLSLLCSSRNSGHRKCLADIHQDEYGRRGSEEEYHDAGGSMPVPDRSHHRLPRILRLSDIRQAIQVIHEIEKRMCNEILR